VADLGSPHRPVTVLLEREEPIAVVRLNRPEALNALSNQLMSELVGALENLDDDEAVRCIVIAGDEKAFASGADIGELSDPTPLELYFGGRIDKWDAIRSVRTPIVAAVSGYCLGGGCELAMACDLIVASETAQFGQPETNLGVMPGAGGTQRLTRAIGKSKAMDVILTGRFLAAREAEAAGLVARVVAAEAWLDEAKRIARTIAAKSPVGVRLAKEAVNQAFETNLRAGLDAERKAFHLALSSEDAQEGMKAFLEKRPPDFKGK
jgi:enoyl-CoA hydratase